MVADARRIAFIAFLDGWVGLNIVNDDGSGLRRMRADDAVGLPDWSPDGTAITFTSSFRDGAQFNSEILLADPESGAVTRLTSTPQSEDAPAWSPEGRQLAYSRRANSASRNSDIWVMDADGSNQRQLTTHEAPDSFPTWSPDGSRIAFSSTRDGNAEIYVMAADGAAQTSLTRHPADDSDPEWQSA